MTLGRNIAGINDQGHRQNTFYTEKLVQLIVSLRVYSLMIRKAVLLKCSQQIYIHILRCTQQIYIHISNV